MGQTRSKSETREESETMTDPERLDEEIDDIEPDIEFDYGKEYGELSDAEKEEVINNHFFVSNPNIGSPRPSASKEIRIVLDGYRRGEVRGRDVKVSRFKRRGQTYTVIRDSETGKIRQFVRD